MEDMLKNIGSLIEGVVLDLTGLSANVDLVRPAKLEFGHWSTNVAMQVFGVKKKNGDGKYGSSIELAKEIIEKLGIVEGVLKMEVMGPGFINIFLTDKALVSMVESRAVLESPKKVLVEYSSPNVAKKFGVGHLRSTIIGQAIFNIYKSLGVEVIGDNHLGDWGTQFGVIIAAVELYGIDMDKTSVGELERIYVDYNKLIEEDVSYKEKARDAFARLEKREEKAVLIWEKSLAISLAEFDRIYQVLGVKIDHAYGESHYEELMKDVVIPQVSSKIGKESQGAIIVEFEGMPPAMLVKSNGTTTYFTRDLATIYFRQNNPELKSDLYIYEVGSEQELHFRQVFKAAQMMGWIEEGQCVHVSHGLMSLPEGKISTRKGRTVNLEELLERSVEEARLKIGEDREVDREVVAKAVGIGAVKFNELRHTPRSDYVFRFEEALNLEGDSGPYLQYALVRCRAILNQAGEIDNGVFDFEENERRLVAELSYFGYVKEVVARTFSPNLLCSYLISLSGEWSSFYNNVRILQSEDEDKKRRVWIVRVTEKVLSEGLEILGIPTLEKM